MKTEINKQFAVVCIGQFPDGSGKYIVKQSVNLKQVDRVVSYHDGYEEAKESAKNAPNSEIRFTVRKYH